MIVLLKKTWTFYERLGIIRVTSHTHLLRRGSVGSRACHYKTESGKLLLPFFIVVFRMFWSALLSLYFSQVQFCKLMKMNLRGFQNYLKSHEIHKLESSYPAKFQKKQCGGVYFWLYGIAYWIPIQQKLPPPVLLLAILPFGIVAEGPSSLIFLIVVIIRRHSLSYNTENICIQIHLGYLV